MKTLHEISRHIEAEARQIMLAAALDEEISLAVAYHTIPCLLKIAKELHAEGRTKLAIAVIRDVGGKLYHYKTGLQSSDVFRVLRRRAISR